MNCTWDENKNQLNIRDHKLSFEVAQLVFDDPLHISRKDRVEDGEERWQTVGQIAGRYIVLFQVAFKMTPRRRGGSDVDVRSSTLRN